MGQQKKNSHTVEIKMAEAAGKDEEELQKMKNKDKKINFLNMELTDIKNNKGAVTM